MFCFCLTQKLSGKLLIRLSGKGLGMLIDVKLSQSRLVLHRPSANRLLTGGKEFLWIQSANIGKSRKESPKVDVLRRVVLQIRISSA